MMPTKDAPVASNYPNLFRDLKDAYYPIIILILNCKRPLPY